MRSFAFWCKKKGNTAEKTIDADVHFNLWTEYDEKESTPFLDVGIKISNLEAISKMFFYVPFIMKKNDIEDLGSVLSKNKEVLNAVFNETFTIKDDKKTKQVTVLEDDVTKFIIYSLDVVSNIKLDQNFDGTIIELSTDNIAISSGVKYYFRFRIKSEELKDLIKERQPQNVLLQSAVSSNCFIDFRFNDIRSINKSLVEHIESADIKVLIKKVHFLLLTRADIDLASNTAMNERQLETHIWKDYLLGYEPTDTIVANHWRIGTKDSGEEQDEVNGCVIYIKFKVYRCNSKTIRAYIVVLFLLTLFFNIISSLVFEWGKKLFP
jgi:hypothetical protein